MPHPFFAARPAHSRLLAPALALASLFATAQADEPPKPLLEIKPGAERRLVPSSAQVTVAPADPAPGLVVSIQPGPEGYPGVSLKPEQGTWDLSKFGHIEARVVNTGAKTEMIALRVDNAGRWQDNPNNTENVYLQPGEAKTIVTIFGYANGRKPGFALKPGAVTGIILFTTKAGTAQSFRLESLTAAGPAGEKPPVDPASLRVKPENGFLLGGPGKPAAIKLAPTAGAETTLATDAHAVDIHFSKKGQSVSLKPPQGAWDLRAAHQVTLKLKNIGPTAATPLARVDSQAGSTDKIALAQPLAPGATAELTVSFLPAVPWTGVKDSAKTQWNPTPGTGTGFTSDAATAVTLLADDQGGPQVFIVESITATAPPASLPEWLGQRPPIPGEWVQTFNEDFNGTAIDLHKWNIYAANYWDKPSHFSKDNVVLENGLAHLRYVRHPGRHNDDPKGQETPYATGYLDTFGKWVQRYGYFEARMKLPQAPGLWPAFWLMPDRGLASGEAWKRASTGQGAMEFDVMEFLSRWGGHRYNIAFHWDGYGQEHQQMGNQNIYTATDKDGFLTAGLLWTPGEAVLYCNGAVVARWASPRISSVPADLMFTHVMGGWDNNALDDTQLPDEFVIDYVRVWQRKDLASEADGVKSTEPTPTAPVRAK